ncbi:hypothetical protein PHYSODRAFT_534938 [Phytophthora sojae]|uniref:C2H2-type domain-containing protein n=1 Tax=Phytophthora sojae (strain P6497) TaxID=1094619 RepID=G5AHK0_PHYSP|nr:hypothetical protein PHYSODRAFT_512545 [Phytophthora sojae]XP_009539522.1 hypothetical protein PHYSODRAFT_534944 [Phytophthora sojae]XP_009539551.1 hypothetical protein PHYSODRAFT_534938 [Phytophthora sojae]EGZ05013.1 hypothetical protein PHYSODRAFT_534944 [Phytophthora sojae]EGZ05042.1 hypothetical protein PHYSODRAFT_534938 [Phytophthora sojae]EGZ14305.1 hypothetical protein PHYSODRAFT_512545 [Phytophthora sojae]|eukprot:XP_009531734.1 hypothetical protein PHYSODRAFT_512545 [Phytophthora sojae]
MERADRLKYPKSGYKLKAITGFRVYNYKRNYTLGDSAAVIPKEFRDSIHIINFPKTNNKCVFHCIAYHGLGIAKQNPRTIQVHVKAAFKKYCEFKNIEYSLSLFRSFKPIDIFHFDELEECFKLAINVYSKDVSSGEVKCERESEKAYNVLNILSHSNRALYINNMDKFMSKYLCSKCEMIFATSTKLNDHQKNQCDKTNIMSFAKQPTIYQPGKNFAFQMMQKYKVHDATPYNDHFIVYDFESILKPTNIQSGENTVFMNEHIPVSVSILNTLTNSYFCIVEETLPPE